MEISTIEINDSSFSSKGTPWAELLLFRLYCPRDGAGKGGLPITLEPVTEPPGRREVGLGVEAIQG